jgi:type IV fimbrial biogenesis protein FimT
MRRMRGFTLIELLVTLAIAAMLAVFAVPAWSTFWARQQLNAEVNAAVSALALARSDAIRLHRRVEVEFLPPAVNRAERRPVGCRDGETRTRDEGEERYGYASWCYRVLPNDESEALRMGRLKHLSQPSEKFSLGFEPLGTADIDDCLNGGSSVCQLAFMPDDLEHDSDDYPVTLFINITGSIRREAP